MIEIDFLLKADTSFSKCNFDINLILNLASLEIFVIFTSAIITSNPFIFLLEEMSLMNSPYTIVTSN